MSPFEFFGGQVIGEPTLLLGLAAFIGFLLARVSFYRTLSGTIKVMVGTALLQIGASAAGVSLSNLAVMVQDRFQIIGFIPHNEAVMALVQINFGREVALTVTVALVLHLLLARFTPFKYIFLSGHQVLFMGAVIVAVLQPTYLGSWQFLIGGGVLALSMTFAPALIQPYVRSVTGDNSIAIGHFNSVGYFLSGALSKALFKKREQSYQFPAFLRRFEPLMQDHILVICLFSFVLFFGAALFSFQEGMTSLFGNQPFFVYAMIQSLWFTAGMYSIINGVRMMVSEIVPAFEGISRKWIKGSIPAIDAPVLFPYAPLAAIVGFLLSFGAGILAMLVMVQIQYTIIIPGVIPHFFSGGAAGVIAYRLRGIRALLVIGPIHGLLISLLPLLLLPFLTELGYTRTTFGDSDLQLIGILLGWLLQ
ncbi:PTS transporter subunit IIC [Alkalicoccobacillus porphyridii]|uniref:Ascorbate-specific PTS system EIIC component n=1 Tax=Alkalicoccobacillus porphyridii TaxID=2597270 RepID=A0A554A481_9BACI|nr:PTS transporter subunit IIC [Alkalicoccobacillus porphyridii]TSB48497.1 PTS ascorbate transporter subunit IIC [Alkalicoccobacillus porphyridii]